MKQTQRDIQVDLDYAIKQLKLGQKHGVSYILLDCTQRALDALERINANINPAGSLSESSQSSPDETR